ncbi:hypothetical protein BKA70DRAFT_1301081 [Coprinopsis sp. MPI-PUGE-AT-0042]|nr:hypothetical protein BKA70DRAFT_1301081 [Coprinopsis sp. MPI-PUGE-AT-0042]
MSKIVPSYSGPLTANGLKVWLGQVEDAMENYVDTHKDTKLEPKTRIRLTGAALLEPAMSEWWSQGRTGYLALDAWEKFVEKIKDRFLPVGWKMEALEKFYGCMQGKRDFQTFSGELAQCHGALPSSTISAQIFKYHILFYSHPQLYLRMRALPDFDIEKTDQSVDQLIALMSHQWESLMADIGPRSSRPMHPSSTVSLRTSVTASGIRQALPQSQASSSYLSEEDRKELDRLKGCYNCHRKPGDPGNPSINAPPGKDYVASATGGLLAGLIMGPPRDADTSDEDDGLPCGESDDESE